MGGVALGGVPLDSQHMTDAGANGDAWKSSANEAQNLIHFRDWEELRTPSAFLLEYNKNTNMILGRIH